MTSSSCCSSLLEDGYSSCSPSNAASRGPFRGGFRRRFSQPFQQSYLINCMAISPNFGRRTRLGLQRRGGIRTQLAPEGADEPPAFRRKTPLTAVLPSPCHWGCSAIPSASSHGRGRKSLSLCPAVGVCNVPLLWHQCSYGPRGITLLHNEPSSRTEKYTLSGILLAENKKLTCRFLGWPIPAEIEG